MFPVTCLRREPHPRLRQAMFTPLAPATAARADTPAHAAARDPRWRRAGQGAGLAAGALLLAACGGAGPGSPGAANGGPSAPASPNPIAFAQCMRAHGVANYPDSGGPLKVTGSGDLNPGNPTYRKARQSCQSLLPAIRLSPAQAAQGNADALRFAHCMRQHGITKFPDPRAGTDGNDMVNLSGIDLHSPQFLAAQHACRRYQGPDGKG
jgi:hypothetical protein